MAHNVSMSDADGVRSRISWGAVFAGFFIALVSLVLLSSLGSAIGFTAARSQGVETQQITRGTAIYGVITTLISLFLGGWATSRCVARETKLEAGFSGLVLWGVTFVALSYLALQGISLGLGTVMGINTLLSNHAMTAELRNMAELLQLTPEQQGIFQEMLRNSINEANVVEATWWSFLGIVLSMLATVLGAIIGSGPKVNIRRVSGHHHSARGIQPVRL